MNYYISLEREEIQSQLKGLVAVSGAVREVSSALEQMPQDPTAFGVLCTPLILPFSLTVTSGLEQMVREQHNFIQRIGEELTGVCTDFEALEEQIRSGAHGAGAAIGQMRHR